jgi:hypothetical protein
MKDSFYLVFLFYDNGTKYLNFCNSNYRLHSKSIKLIVHINTSIKISKRETKLQTLWNMNEQIELDVGKQKSYREHRKQKQKREK